MEQDWNEDPESIPHLVVVPEPAPTSSPSELGAAFKARGVAPPPVPEAGIEKWEPVGDIPAVVESDRGSGHMLTDAQIARDYARDQAMKRRPGPLLEDIYKVGP